jgi:hypothetical protein
MDNDLRPASTLGGFLAAITLFAWPAIAVSDLPPNTIASYDPGMFKTSAAYGPLFSQHIARSNTEEAAPGDFVEQIQVPDGTAVRVLVKAPAPAQPSKILKVPPITSSQTANAYFDDALRQAISGGYATVIFPKNVYNFVAPAASKDSHWLVKGAKDLVIDGQGSTLNFVSPISAGITISNSQRIVFRGFDVDWRDQVMASVGAIVAIDKSKNPHTMRVRIGPQYRVSAHTQIIALSPWDAKSDPANPHLSLTSAYKEQYTNNQGTVYLGNNVFEVPYWNNYIEVGDVVLVRHFGWAPWKNAIQTGNSYDLDFEHVNIYASPYLGFLLAGGGGYRLSHCSVTRLNPSRLISSAADAVHISDNTGDIIIEDSTFGYQGDDGTNIHGALGNVIRVAPQTFRWLATGEGSYAPYGWVANDEIGFFNAELKFQGVTTFKSLSNSKLGLTIELRDEAPKGATQIANLSRVSARFVIRNNRYLYNRARGLLLQSSFGLVENNEFTGQTGHGIIVGAAPGSEGPGVQNVVFRGNRFSNVGSFPNTPLPNIPDVTYGSIVIAIQGNADNVQAMNPVHQDLLFDSNAFSDLKGPALFLSRTNGVVVANNQFKNTNLMDLRSSRIGTANLGGSIVITHAHNIYISKSSIQGRTTGPVAIDAHSTDGIRQ